MGHLSPLFYSTQWIPTALWQKKVKKFRLHWIWWHLLHSQVFCRTPLLPSSSCLSNQAFSAHVVAVAVDGQSCSIWERQEVCTLQSWDLQPQCPCQHKPSVPAHLPARTFHGSPRGTGIILLCLVASPQHKDKQGGLFRGSPTVPPLFIARA